MNRSNELKTYIVNKMNDLEESGKTSGGFYQSLAGWLSDAEKFIALGDYVFDANYNDQNVDPRSWATACLYADARLRAYVRFGGPRP